MPFIHNIENFQTGWDQVSSSWIDLDWFDDKTVYVPFFCSVGVGGVGFGVDMLRLVEKYSFKVFEFYSLLFSMGNYCRHHHNEHASSVNMCSYVALYYVY